MNVEVDEPNANPAPPTITDEANVVQGNAGTTRTEKATTDSQHRTEPVQNTSAVEVPNINGTWVGKDGTVYFVQQNDDGTFK